MGYIRHHAIVVTSWDAKKIAEAHTVAVGVFGPIVSSVMDGIVNEYKSFFIAPDGSKEGWDEDMNGNEHRDEFVSWLETQRYDDGSSSLRWVEVQYGDDDYETRVVRDSDASLRAKP